MRTARKNKQSLKYALYTSEMPIYETDRQGNIIYDDNNEPVETGDYTAGYAEPVDFLGNIAFASGEAEAESFGINIDDYDSKIVMNINEIPINETSLIFKDSEPQYDENHALIPESADYKVVKVAPSLHEVNYLLRKMVH